jgi:menaquinone-9 beta-reductase
VVNTVNVVGAGPAGCSAALAALAEGSAVTLYEKSRFPRHKVCGEFLSPEILSVIESLHLESAFLAARPARLASVILRSGSRQKRFRFPEPAYSLSRFALDRLLLDEASRRGASFETRACQPPWKQGEPTVIAHGRHIAAPKGGRLFGFKAHFRGPLDEADAVEMFFFPGGYAGVSAVEDGAVNVCGLAPEEMLRPHDFHPEPLFSEALRARLHSLEQSYDWLMTGPLVFHRKFHRPSDVYLAGDAMGFVDPFTGSGILSAMLTGKLAGRSAARGLAVEAYNAECRRILGRQYGISSLVRKALGAELAMSLVRWIPLPLLYRLTRPEVVTSM